METGLLTSDQKVKDYAHSMKKRLNHRYHDLQTNDVFKGIKLLDTCLWPNDMEALIEFLKNSFY